MSLRKYPLNPGIMLLLTLALSSLAAAEKLDLTRTTPVPDNEQIPVQDFFRPSAVHSPSLNPDGTHIAAIIPAYQVYSDLMVYDFKTQKAEALGNKEEIDISAVSWLNNNRLIYQMDFKKRGWGGNLCAAETGALYRGYPLLQSTGANLIAVPPSDRLHPLVSISRNTNISEKYGEVLTIDAAYDLSNEGDKEDSNLRHVTARHPVLEVPDGFDLRYLADKEGRLAYAVSSLGGMRTFHRLDDNKWVKCPLDLEEIKVIGSGDNPGEIVVLAPRRDGKPRALEVWEAATGKVLEVLVQDKAYDGDAWLYRDPVTHNIVGAIYDREGPNVAWFNDNYRNLQKMVNGLFANQVVRIIGNDEAGKMVLFSVFSDRQPASYNWVDLEKKSAGLFKNSAPWIDPKRMRPMSPVKFKTRDGQQLDAYVTMPEGASKQNPPPMVVLPHDHYDGRDNWGYNAEVQFLASRGYAVLQPNYRGSSGTTWKFPRDDEWAFRKMSDDVADATNAMIKSGLVDAKRIAIMGTRFGGYLALSGVAFEPGLYGCAIAISPIADWGNHVRENKYNEHTDEFYSRMVLKLGDPKKDEARYAAMSPLRQADSIAAPLFLAFGELDNSKLIGDAKSLASVVSRKQISVETISFLNESDRLDRHFEHKVELYSRIEAFLEKNLKTKR